jgi:hypothetical protein
MTNAESVTMQQALGSAGVAPGTSPATLQSEQAAPSRQDLCKPRVFKGSTGSTSAGKPSETRCFTGGAPQLTSLLKLGSTGSTSVDKPSETLFHGEHLS